MAAVFSVAVLHTKMAAPIVIVVMTAEAESEVAAAVVRIVIRIGVCRSHVRVRIAVVVGVIIVVVWIRRRHGGGVHRAADAYAEMDFGICLLGRRKSQQTSQRDHGKPKFFQHLPPPIYWMRRGPEGAQSFVSTALWVLEHCRGKLRFIIYLHDCNNFLDS